MATRIRTCPTRSHLPFTAGWYEHEQRAPAANDPPDVTQSLAHKAFAPFGDTLVSELPMADKVPIHRSPSEPLKGGSRSE